ncbi:aminopeptidase [Candidatus Woesearchaeota archaeon]|nr:aminopeptidase [Candidatus Woesearchaeota archaeon]
MLSKLDKAISIVYSKNLGVKQQESVVIVYDVRKERLAKRFKKIGLLFSDSVELLKIPLAKVNGQEPPLKASKEMKKYKVALFITSFSLSHTKARRDMTKKGIRIASMPMITGDILKRSIDIDYKRLKQDTLKLGKKLDKAKTVRIKTSFGTDFGFSVKGRKAHGLKAGIFDKKGYWGNLPEGEAFIAPVEGTASGVFVVDGSIAGFGKTGHPLIFFVENGFLKKVTDGKKPPQIEKVLDKVGRKARNIAELGIGLNRKAKVTGIVLEDEKVYGTCHIALGNNIGFGGTVNVPLHIDCVITRPDIYFDKKLVMKKGKLL